MGWFSKLLTPKVVDDVFDKDNGHLSKIGAWIGNSKFTDEEQAEMWREMGKGAAAHAVDTMGENTERSKTRRRLAVMIMQFELLCLFLAGMLFPFDENWSRMWWDIATSNLMFTLSAGVGAFFFGSHLISSHLPSKKS